MNHLAAGRRKRLGGMSAKSIAIPLSLVIGVLQIAIILLIINANLQNAKLARTIGDYSRYESEASSLVSGASALNGTATTYVNQADKSNVGALMGYVTEIRNHPERRPATIAAHFENYNVGTEAKRHIRQAEEAAQDMYEIQMHAIALMLSAYPSADPSISTLTLPALSAEDAALTAEEKAAEAGVLLNASSYLERMGTVSTNVTNCVEALRDESGEVIAHNMATIRGIRLSFLFTTILFSGLLLGGFLVIYRKMIAPLDGFIRGIAADRPLDEKKGLYEVRRLANSYNALLRRRESLETVLRFAAETDQLTNLPNRYRFEQYFYDSGRSGYSCAFLVFDVNHLKETNDKKGHLAGDELIRHAAECIGDCFGVPGENNCFRIGGDEFAAIVKRASRADVDRRLAWFVERQKELNVSVAVGLCYAEEIGDTDFRDMFLTADRNMYTDKMREHSERKAVGV
ncbi:MAG: GGDEF domain-containing protein [Clostridia bacterium]|nr:GGDEF domain-containing protein [Clostridia bacterium]MBR5044963.1 GGDEF domain-containing protein [Clostridia bacterium]